MPKSISKRRAKGSSDKDPDNHKEHPDPFLFADSKVYTGQGRAIVCAVGDMTRLARNRRPGDLVISEKRTFLESKLEKCSTQIQKYATFLMLFSVITHAMFLVFLNLLTDENNFFSASTCLRLGQICIIAIALLMVAIPEGLPLAVSIAMALSINNLKKDNILIKNLDSV